ncbi:hypothetical protein [Flavisolibacter tropicus]|uniref:Uncharacterized protein n=1 Tax=Flavisolibacter tropicus TaxID=1492898 RepID=A0A172TV29_9BACT|nr:hypothetical protein [Flavisolibacter tropicus]ANE50828.1 hypothetical protein SY85_10235 [Flavisolibacter tropicus]
MAKQVGPVFITGTIDGIIFYKLGDTYYLRSKGDYKSAKRMRKDPRLKRTMANADRFGVAARMVKRVYYRQLPGTVRKPGLFARLTGMVNKWLYQGKTKEEAQELLLAHCQTLLSKEMITTSMLPPIKVKQQPSISEVKTIPPPCDQQPIAMPRKQNVKKARYLSHWKVKRNGRLQISRSDGASLPCRSSEQLSDTTKLCSDIPYLRKRHKGQKFLT